MSRPITDTLRQTFPDLPDNLLERLSAVATQHSYAPAHVLCREDEHEDTFYIIQAGEVAFSKHMGDSDRVLRIGTTGELFGEMALLDENVGRSATVTTTQPTIVIEIEREAFVELVKTAPSLVLALSRIIIQRMRENDRLALQELQAQKEQIERAYDDLSKLNHQRELFLTTLAHELRTPLTSVMGYMSLVRAGHMTGPALTMSLDKIGQGLDRMVSLINDLYFLQQMEAVEPRFQKTNLQEILTEAVEVRRADAQSQRATLTLTITDTLPPILAESDGLLRALDHLIDNAIKFSPAGGDITLRAQHQNNSVQIQISDQGVGISSEFMPRLFERFERDETYEDHLFDGTGLGMPIVKQIIDVHQGSIDVQSARGEGTTITIRLPEDARRATVKLDVPNLNT